MPSSETHSTCGCCSLGCQIRVRKADDQHFWIDELREPGYNRLCRWGRFGPELYFTQSRVTVPLKREGGRTGWSVLSSLAGMFRLMGVNHYSRTRSSSSSASWFGSPV